MLHAAAVCGFCVPARQILIVKSLWMAYTGGMDEETRDFNAFNYLDSGGAVALLAVVAAALNYTFNDKNVTWSVLIVLVGLAAAVVVGALQYFTGQDRVGKLVCLVGGALTILYVIIAVLAWSSDEDDAPPPAEEPAQQSEGH